MWVWEDDRNKKKIWNLKLNFKLFYSKDSKLSAIPDSLEIKCKFFLNKIEDY